MSAPTPPSFTPRTDYKDYPDKSTPVLAADYLRIEAAIKTVLDYSTAVSSYATTAIAAAVAAAAAAQTSANTANTGVGTANTAITALQTALALKPNVVLVTTGTEARPSGNYCLWVDVPTRTPIAQPVNMGANDTWLPAGPPTDVVPPSVPTSLASSAISSTGFTVSWTASTGEPTLYEVFLGGVSYGTTASTSLAVTGRASSTAYSVTVRARDAAGNWSAQTSPLVVTTAAPPTTPTVKQVVKTADGNLGAATLTTSSLAVGDAIYVIQATDNTLAATPLATSSAGALTLVAEQQMDGEVDVKGIIRIYRTVVTSTGTKTVTFPDAEGHDNFGVVLVTNGTSTVDAFAAHATTGSAAVLSYTTGSANLTGSSDLAMAAIIVKMTNVGMTLDPALTQQAMVTAGPFLTLWVGTEARTVSGPTPGYTITKSDTLRWPASIVVGLM